MKVMDLFEAKSDRGIERRVDEAELRNLFLAGYLRLDSLVRRTGSPNWFRVDEMFPHFEKIATGRKYQANIKARPRKNGLLGSILTILAIVLAIFLLVRFTQGLVGRSRGLAEPTTQQSAR